VLATSEGSRDSVPRGAVVWGIVEFFERLQQELSHRDFDRMQKWVAGLPDEKRNELMRFILDREVLAPAVGEKAPDFELPRLAGAGRVRLSSFRGVKPVALIFGSYT
jgi:hypothetical protein